MYLTDPLLLLQPVRYWSFTTAVGTLHTSRRRWPSRSPALSALEPGWTAEMKMPLSLPPTKVISFSRLSPDSDSSCTGFTEELILEKEDRDGRNGLHTDVHARNQYKQWRVFLVSLTCKNSCTCMKVCAVPLQRQFPEDIVDLLQVVSVHPF